MHASRTRGVLQRRTRKPGSRAAQPLDQLLSDEPVEDGRPGVLWTVNAGRQPQTGTVLLTLGNDGGQKLDVAGGVGQGFPAAVLDRTGQGLGGAAANRFGHGDSLYFHLGRQLLPQSAMPRIAAEQILVKLFEFSFAPVIGGYFAKQGAIVSSDGVGFTAVINV